MAAGRPLYRPTEGTQIANVMNRVDSLERRRAVTGFYEIKIFADTDVVTVLDGAFIFAIPLDLTESKLRYVNAFVTTVSSSGILQIMIHNSGHPNDPIGGADFDMLEAFAPIQIDSGELDAETSSVPWEIREDYANEYAWPFQDNTVFYRQQIRIDVLAAGTGAMGLGVMLGFE